LRKWEPIFPVAWVVRLVVGGGWDTYADDGHVGDAVGGHGYIVVERNE
jgi:hypothetical protein